MDKCLVEEQDIMINSKDDQIISLLNQIAADMVKRSDVDETLKKAVAEEHDRLVLLRRPDAGNES